MSHPLDQFDAGLLNLLQEEVPLVDRPFAALATKLGTAEDEVIAHVTALKGPPRPVIRQISAIFDSKSLGYVSTLVAASVDEACLDHAVAQINAHPGVSHNYRRNHAYNLWYTLAVPPDSRLGLERTVEVLHQRSGASATRLLPTLKLFKIGVKMDLSGEADLSARQETPRFAEAQRERAMGYSITEADKRMIRVLQQDLPISPRPFDGWAQQAGVDVDAFLSAAKTYIDQQRMRRFSAVLRHRQAGFSANGMGVWIVPPDRCEEFGKTAASFAAVSHCYLRPTYEDWPYSIFTMVHAPSEAECNGVLAAISKATGVTAYGALYSTHEYKKARVQYFAGDTQKWEQEALSQETPST